MTKTLRFGWSTTWLVLLALLASCTLRAVDTPDVTAPDATDPRDAHAIDTVDAIGADAAHPVDPCSTAHGGCDPLTTCTNVAGLPTCGACPTGYIGTGATHCTWNDPSLSVLVPSAGALSPAFAGATTSYDVTVGVGTASLGLRVSVSLPTENTITVDGSPVAAGQSSHVRALLLGTTVFRVEVTAAGGATRTYTVTVRRASHIVQQAYVKAGDTRRYGVFGCSIALAGDTLVVGAIRFASEQIGFPNNAGAVYVFTRTGTTWTQQAELTRGLLDDSESFGASVAIAGDTIVVGAPTEASSATGIDGSPYGRGADRSGAVYVFARTGTVWTQQAYIKASNTDRNDAFGSSVALSGDTLVVGAVNESSGATGINGDQTDNSASGSGATYIFTRTGMVWTQQAYVKASNTGGGDAFGSSVALSGDTIVVGASGEASSATGIDGNQADDTGVRSGAAYVFTRTGVVWTQQAYVKASNTGEGDAFGSSVAVSGDTIGVGAPYQSYDAPSSGAVYVFTRTGTTWVQQAYVKASNADRRDLFGRDVALSGDTLAVGAIGESSSATGIDGDPSDDSAYGSGAVYVFSRTGTTWTQRTYVKASNTGAGDLFGYSVALAGDTLAVGAEFEDSNATGADGNESDNSATDSGAVYVFQ